MCVYIYIYIYMDILSTGFALYDFYLGKELNPRIGYLDLKYLCELRPGLMAWILLDGTYLIKAIQEQEEFPTNLLLITLCHTLYVADALYFEVMFIDIS